MRLSCRPFEKACGDLGAVGGLERVQVKLTKELLHPSARGSRTPVPWTELRAIDLEQRRKVTELGALTAAPSQPVEETSRAQRQRHTGSVMSSVPASNNAMWVLPSPSFDYESRLGIRVARQAPARLSSLGTVLHSTASGRLRSDDHPLGLLVGQRLLVPILRTDWR